MPHERKPKFDVLSDLRELSNEADALIAEDAGRYSSLLEDWFEAVKDTILQIKNCESLQDVKYAPHIRVFLGEEDQKNKIVESTIPAQKEHVHATEQPEGANKIKKEEGNSTVLPVSIVISEANDCSTQKKSEEKATTPANSCIATLNPVVSLLRLNIQQTKERGTPIIKSESSPQDVMQTPILNLTYNKSMDTTVTLDSGASGSGLQSQIRNADYCDSGLKNKSPTKTLVASKRVINGALSKSGSKRKSANSKNKSSKKQKVDTSEAQPCKSSSRSGKSKPPLVDKVVKKPVVMSSETKAKIPAVIQPVIQKKSVVPSKENQIRQEIKEKDEKANENIKRVLAERQMKAEEKKKIREEKRAKTLQKRMQMEKEKEERLLKAETEAKKSPPKPAKENIKNGPLKTRTQEETDQRVKVITSGVLTNSKQNEANGSALHKTPARKESEAFNNYEITPHPDSSTYSFSDSEDEQPQGKHIPVWAQGVPLKSALVRQYYHPPDVDALFGREVDPPDLVKIFSLKKKHYSKRTSSAIWNTPPSLKC